MTDVKICGITTPEALTAAIEGGARFVGFVFFKASPRYAEPDVAKYLAGYVPHDVRKVGLFVDPTNEYLQQILSEVHLDMVQLHGKESPGRVAEIKKQFGLPIIKALHVAAKEDLESVPGYEVAADWLMFDAKPTAKAEALPGGNGLPFDWTLLQQFSSKRPWFLAGGLTPENVGAALEVLEPEAVDVSSGVESAPGEKDPQKIRAFLKLALDRD